MKSILGTASILAIALSVVSPPAADAQCETNCGTLSGFSFHAGSCDYNDATAICDDGILVCTSFYCVSGSGSNYYVSFNSSCGCT